MQNGERPPAKSNPGSFFSDQLHIEEIVGFLIFSTGVDRPHGLVFYYHWFTITPAAWSFNQNHWRRWLPSYIYLYTSEIHNNWCYSVLDSRVKKIKNWQRTKIIEHAKLNYFHGLDRRKIFWGCRYLCNLVRCYYLKVMLKGQTDKNSILMDDDQI